MRTSQKGIGGLEIKKGWKWGIIMVTGECLEWENITGRDKAFIRLATLF